MVCPDLTSASLNKFLSSFKCNCFHLSQFWCRPCLLRRNGMRREDLGWELGKERWGEREGGVTCLFFCGYIPLPAFKAHETAVERDLLLWTENALSLSLWVWVRFSLFLVSGNTLLYLHGYTNRVEGCPKNVIYHNLLKCSETRRQILRLTKKKYTK